MTRSSTLALTTLLITATAGASANADMVAQFKMKNHPQGILDVDYGLRFDGLFGGWAETAFNVESLGDSFATVYDNDGVLSIALTGTLFGGVLDGAGGFVSPEAWTFEQVYSVGVEQTALGWQVVAPIGTNTGTLTKVSDPKTSITIYSKDDLNGAQFLLEANGYRLPDDNTTWTGHGWLTVPDGQNLTRDWIFVAEVIPSPASLALFGAGGLMALRRRRG